MNKLLFFIKRSSFILVTGKGRAYTKKAISQILEPGVLIFDSDLSEPKEINKFSFFLKKSKLPILVLTNVENKEEVVKIGKLAESLPARAFLVLNSDEEAAREIKNGSPARSLTYGFQEKAEVKATDINISREGTNFKINYQGNIVPFWLKNLFDKEEIYNVLAAICAGLISEINLVDISQSLKSWQK